MKIILHICALKNVYHCASSFRTNPSRLGFNEFFYRILFETGTRCWASDSIAHRACCSIFERDRLFIVLLRTNEMMTQTHKCIDYVFIIKQIQTLINNRTCTHTKRNSQQSQCISNRRFVLIIDIVALKFEK